MKKILSAVLILISSCCPIVIGPPGDEGSIEWIAPEKSSDPEIIIDCNGSERGPLEIRESNTIVKNCTINGGIRIWGIGRNANAPELKEISRQSDYVTKLRSQSPSHVTIEDCTIISSGQIPLYIGPGSTFVTINKVVISGKSSSTMIYLDAESYGTVIKDSVIDATKNGREAIAIDASDHNEINGNTIINSKGGIYLYRNCGENGVIRHTTSSYNRIINNKFYGSETAIWVNAREGGRCYCDEDFGWQFGSSISDLDHSRFNIIENNDLGDGEVKDGI